MNCRRGETAYSRACGCSWNKSTQREHLRFKLIYYQIEKRIDVSILSRWSRSPNVISFFSSISPESSSTFWISVLLGQRHSDGGFIVAKPCLYLWRGLALHLLIRERSTGWRLFLFCVSRNNEHRSVWCLTSLSFNYYYQQHFDRVLDASLV